MRRTLLALSFGASLLGSAALAEGLTDMTEAERQAFRDEVRAYLLENPEVLIEAFEILQAREAEAAALQEQALLRDRHDFIFNDPNSWVGGNPEGDVTIVEFMDYRCGYCRKAYDEVASLIESDGNIRFVVKEFPILGDDSMASARFAIAVLLLHDGEAYEKVHDALMTLRGSPDTATLSRLAQDFGLDPEPILDKMASPEVQSIIAANHDFARAADITGTPTFFIGDQILRGYAPEDVMRQMVVAEREG